jgi:uncharacterized protein YgiB involved in biofilm formation
VNPGESTSYWMPVFTGMTIATRSVHDERFFSTPYLAQTEKYGGAGKDWTLKVAS